jgi:hypothetical protein
MTFSGKQNPIYNVLMLFNNITYGEKIHKIIADAEQMKSHVKKIYILTQRGSEFRSELRKIYGKVYKQTSIYQVFGLGLSFIHEINTWKHNNINPYEQMENSLLIIDEAQKITSDFQRTSGLYDMIFDLAKNTNNLKIILTSQSMKNTDNSNSYQFHTPSQLFKLLNILRINDRKSLIDIDKIWDTDNQQFRESYDQYFYEMSKGYISYLDLGICQHMSYFTLELGLGYQVLKTLDWISNDTTDKPISPIKLSNHIHSLHERYHIKELETLMLAAKMN